MAEEILRVENLTKIYPGGVLANYNINFSVNYICLFDYLFISS